MIKGYKNNKTRRVHQTGEPRGFKKLDGIKAVRILNLLESTLTLAELPRLASHRLHSKDRNHQLSITINLPWAVFFTPSYDGGWEDVGIVDCH